MVEVVWLLQHAYMCTRSPTRVCSNRCTHTALRGGFEVCFGNHNCCSSYSLQSKPDEYDFAWLHQKHC